MHRPWASFAAAEVGRTAVNSAETRKASFAKDKGMLGILGITHLVFAKRVRKVLIFYYIKIKSFSLI